MRTGAQQGSLDSGVTRWSALLPNNLERDTATRIRPPKGQVADVTPLQVFGNKAVIEGVY